MRITSLPWYDTRSSHRALDRFWSLLGDALRAEGIDRLPETLDRSQALELQWAHTDLLLSQCCGLDLFTPAARAVLPIGRPVFADIECEPGSYFSYIAATPGIILPPRRIVVNSPSSHSGYTALLGWMDERAWPRAEVLISGSHQTSVHWLRRGLADLAAIDAHTWSLIDREGVVIVGRSPTAPTPPYIGRNDGNIPREVVLHTLHRAVAQGGALLGIDGILPADIELYRPLARTAVALGVTGIDLSRAQIGDRRR